jgi:beta-galactosidase
VSETAGRTPEWRWPATAGDGLAYGADYNPDQWPEETWAEDVRLMREARVNLVSVGIFSWARLEPEPGRFDLAWLDRVLDLLHANGVAVNLATPTASPPAWLIEQHPEILPVDERGSTIGPGSRRHYCPHAPAYRDAARRIARRLAEHFANHPALVMWHVDNEYGCHIGDCFCEASRAAFREWLERRYGSVAALNEAWGTAVWGQTYGAWSQVLPPGLQPTFSNPGHELDWRRFWSDSWVECFGEQKQILREVTPELPVATNFMGMHPGIDYWALAASEDLVANDSYPETSDPDWQVETAMVCDLIRSLGRGRPWLLMEQAVAYATWRPRNSTKRPGVMRLGSYQAVARGADGVMFFQWRTSPSGAEMHMAGLVGHAGTDNRQWREAVGLGAELEGLAELRGSRVTASVAILFDWAVWWALDSEGRLDSSIRLRPFLDDLYAAFHRRGISVDFAPPDADLSGYSLVVAPYLYLVNDAAAENVRRYVRSGGTVLMSFFSGIVDANARIRRGECPAPFSEMLGLCVEEFAPFAGEMANSIRTSDGRTFDCSVWGEVVRTRGASALAGFEGDFYAGLPAVTVNRYGAGRAIYLATMPDRAGLAWVVETACETAGVAATPGASAQVEILRRAHGDREWVFVLNHSSRAVEVPIDFRGRELLTGSECQGVIRLGPVDLAIVAVDAG